MPTVRLLLRETTTACLTSLVTKSLQSPGPHAEYTLRLTPEEFELTETCDEGFESDIESIISGGGGDKSSGDADSANGSTTSSDCESEPLRKGTNSKYDLVHCMCYDLADHPDILVVVIRSTSVYVFRFERVEQLQSFYSNFSAYKALANQKATGRPIKYSLLQRTDRNGVTHTEITNNNNSSKHLDKPILVNKQPLRKVWMSSSADNLLEPKKVERRKKPPAPQPPPINVANVREKKPLISMPTWTTLIRQKKEAGKYFPPMAYRYIDATKQTCRHGNGMTDRLFGLSPRLRDFGFHGDAHRWKSATDLTLKSEAGLKSVIKKEEKKKKNTEKKVTFSAYTTVQVL